MKRIERKHLKENELAQTLEAARGYIEPRKSALTTVAMIVVVAIIAIVAVGIWRGRSRGESERALAEAMVALNAPVVPAGVEGAEGVPAAAQIGATGTFATEEAKLNAAVPKLKAAADAHPIHRPAFRPATIWPARSRRSANIRKPLPRSTTSWNAPGTIRSTDAWRASARPMRRPAPGSSTPPSRRGKE
jgi:hypothetical protein